MITWWHFGGFPTSVYFFLSNQFCTFYICPAEYLLIDICELFLRIIDMVTSSDLQLISSRSVICKF